MADVPAPDPEYVRRQREMLKRPRPPRDRVKVAGQVSDLVLDDERVDRKFEREEAKRRHDVFDEDRERRLDERRNQRGQRSIGDRLDGVLQRLAKTEGGMRARPIASMRRDAGEALGGSCPPQTTHRGREVNEHVTLIEHHLQALEALLDAEDGLLLVPPKEEGFFRKVAGHAGSEVSSRMMGTGERDRIVVEQFAGVRSDTVAREAPYLGKSARTIERARVNGGKALRLRVRPVDGMILGELHDAA